MGLIRIYIFPLLQNSTGSIWKSLMFELPKTYKEWKHCIKIKCGIELTED